MADNGLTGRVIGVALDGTGYGTDGQIWGGEFLACGYDSFDRRGHFAYVPLAGGDSAVRQPWRSALAYLMAAYGRAIPPMLDLIPPARVAAVRAMIQRRVQTVETSSCGRLFDAVASILGLRHEATYEGQAGIELESAASGVGEPYPFAISAAEPFQIDLRETIRAICADKLRGVAVPQISANFHSTLARVIADACARIREIEPLRRVCLSGGTFQNLRLLELTAAALGQRGFEVFTHRRVPTNDGGLSLGQAVIANQMIRYRSPPTCIYPPLGAATGDREGPRPTGRSGSYLATGCRGAPATSGAEKRPSANRSQNLHAEPRKGGVSHLVIFVGHPRRDGALNTGRICRLPMATAMMRRGSVV
jgi:hydrogenase maturation protein HypF